MSQTLIWSVSRLSLLNRGEKPKVGVGEAKTRALHLGSLSCEIPLALYFILPLCLARTSELSKLFLGPDFIAKLD